MYIQQYRRSVETIPLQMPNEKRQYSMSSSEFTKQLPNMPDESVKANVTASSIDAINAHLQEENLKLFVNLKINIAKHNIRYN